MNERPRALSEGEAVQALFAQVEEAMYQGRVDALTGWLAACDPDTVEKIRENLDRLQETDREAFIVALRRLEDEAILSEPEFQESMQQYRAGELVDIGPESDKPIDGPH